MLFGWSQTKIIWKRLYLRQLIWNFQYSSRNNSESSSLYPPYKWFAKLSLYIAVYNECRWYQLLLFSSNNLTQLEQVVNEDLTRVTDWLIANKLRLLNLFSFISMKICLQSHVRCISRTRLLLALVFWSEEDLFSFWNTSKRLQRTSATAFVMSCGGAVTTPKPPTNKQKLQNRASRILTFSNYDVDANDLFLSLA